MKGLLLLGACAILVAPGADAATLNALGYVYGRVQEGGSSTHKEASDDRIAFDTALDGPRLTALARLQGDVNAYEAGASGDIATGEYATNVRSINADYPGNLAWGETSSFESFTATGAGTVAFDLRLAGDWNVGALSEGDETSHLSLIGWMYISELGDADGAQPRFLLRQTAETLQKVGSVSRLLSYLLPIENGKSYGFTTTVATMLENVLDGDGSATFSGRLSVTPGAGVSIAYGDPAFLSEVPPAPVPLPASGLLLLGGFGAASLLRWRRSPAV